MMPKRVARAHRAARGRLAAWVLAASLLGVGVCEAAGIDLTRAPTDDVSVVAAIGGGRPRAVQVDTGSVGLLVWRGDIGPDATALGPGEREYNSSGRVFRGTYFRTRIAFATSAGPVRTALLRVLGVESVACDPAKPGCRPDDAARLAHVGVLGVGFDRPAFTGGDTLGQADNPFLRLARMDAGALARRYEIGLRGVTLGGAAAGYRTLKLARRAPATAPADWQRPRGCYTLRTGTGRFGPVCARLLVDTGLPETILTLPPARRPAEFACDPRCPSGIAVRIVAGDALDWRYVSGAAAAPAYLRWGRNGDTTQINTGRAVLRRYDYLYDADRGVVGFRARR